ncbi:MAG: ERF family protein, partial [Bradyrhizobium sp.]
EIATVQTTNVDQIAGQIQLTTLLAHASGEWISSEWPVCLTSETANPHRMGAALSYARRYALFALVGIAGEDDLDAPDQLGEPSPAITAGVGSDDPRQDKKPRTGSIHKPRQTQPILAPASSAVLRDQMISEINDTKDGDLALWVHKRLAAKNTLTANDASAMENVFQSRLEPSQLLAADDIQPPIANLFKQTEMLHYDLAHMADSAPAKVSPILKTIRKRSKAHLRFVGSQPCLICQQTPCDAHHLKFSQPRSLGSKVSDEFTVPLCRKHHQQLHQHGNELAWWANMQVAPSEIAKELWLSSQQIPSPEAHSLLLRPMPAQAEKPHD